MNTSMKYGKRLISQTLDEMASAEPHRIIYSVAILSDISHEFRHISARTFANAVFTTRLENPRYFSRWAISDLVSWNQTTQA